MDNLLEIPGGFSSLTDRPFLGDEFDPLGRKLSNEFGTIDSNSFVGSVVSSAVCSRSLLMPVVLGALFSILFFKVVKK